MNKSRILAGAAVTGLSAWAGLGMAHYQESRNTAAIENAHNDITHLQQGILNTEANLGRAQQEFHDARSTVGQVCLASLAHYLPGADALDIYGVAGPDVAKRAGQDLAKAPGEPCGTDSAAIAQTQRVLEHSQGDLVSARNAATEAAQALHVEKPKLEQKIAEAHHDMFFTGTEDDPNQTANAAWAGFVAVAGFSIYGIGLLAKDSLNDNLDHTAGVPTGSGAVT
jgi:hypothetical protein